MTHNAAAWLSEIVGSDSTNEIARRSGLTVSTVHRQRASGSFSPETMAAIARAYGANVLDALIAHGVLSATDVESGFALDALRDATDEQLVNEIARRLEGVADGEGGIFDAPKPPVPLRPVNVGSDAEDETQTRYDDEAAARPRARDRGEDNYDN